MSKTVDAIKKKAKNTHTKMMGSESGEVSSINVSTLDITGTSNTTVASASDSTSVNVSKDISTFDNVTANKIDSYRKRAMAEKKRVFSDIYEQQNVYIDKKLTREIEGVLKKSGKKKKDIYNEALSLYLDIVCDIKVDLDK